MIETIKSWFGIYPVFGGVARSGKWPEIQKAFLREHPTCAVCGTKGGLLNALNVHHCMPYHLNPALELDPANLITLCRPHHLLVGHLMQWASFNKDVRADCALWIGKIQSRP